MNGTTARWTRHEPGHYSWSEYEIRREQIGGGIGRNGAAAVMTWRLYRGGARVGSFPSLVAAKRRAR